MTTCNDNNKEFEIPFTRGITSGLGYVMFGPCSRGLVFVLLSCRHNCLLELYLVILHVVNTTVTLCCGSSAMKFLDCNLGMYSGLEKCNWSMDVTYGFPKGV